MTDAELRNAAVAELKLTTAGWRKTNGASNYPSGTAPATSHWGKAMTLLDQIGAVVPPPPPPPPPTTGNPIPSGGVISQGGVYTASDYSGLIFVQTAQPVAINGQARNPSGGIIKVQAAGAQVTVEHFTAIGSDGYNSTGRWFEAIAGWKSIVIRSCSVVKTRGIQLENSTAGGSLVIDRVRHENVQANGKNPVGNFLQLREVTSASIDVGWIECVNEYKQSAPEDIISVYGSRGLRLHDFFFDGQWWWTNAENSQNTVTMEANSNGNEVWNGILVGCRSIGNFSGAHDNLVHDNLNVWDGKLPDGTTASYWSQPWSCSGAGSGNHFYDNQSNYTNQGSARPGTFCDATDKPRNTQVTMTADQARTLWAQRKAAAGVTIGA